MRTLLTIVGILLLIAGAVVALAFGHSGYAQHTRRMTRVAIVTGEDSYPGHHWKDTSAELKTILEAGKPDFNFEVTIEAGEALVRGPYVAETIPVSIAEEFVVVDV